MNYNVTTKSVEPINSQVYKDLEISQYEQVPGYTMTDEARKTLAGYSYIKSMVPYITPPGPDPIYPCFPHQIPQILYP